MNAISFIVPGVPAPAGSKRGFVKGGRVVITDASAKSRPWKAQVADAAAQAMDGRALLEGPLMLELTFWMPRPKGHIGRHGNVLPSAPGAPIVKPDLLKLARAVEDALTGLCYRDDAQIVTEILQKAYTTTSARVDVCILPAFRSLPTAEAVAA